MRSYFIIYLKNTIFLCVSFKYNIRIQNTIYHKNTLSCYFPKILKKLARNNYKNSDHKTTDIKFKRFYHEVIVCRVPNNRIYFLCRDIFRWKTASGININTLFNAFEHTSITSDNFVKTNNLIETRDKYRSEYMLMKTSKNTREHI